MALTDSLCHAPISHAPMSHSPQRSRFGDWRVLLDEWRRRARGRRELAALCDRCLRDIGLTRYEAVREVRKPFWRA
jgi:uncharacterized protein YjiS (DUF1127 family)